MLKLDKTVIGSRMMNDKTSPYRRQLYLSLLTTRWNHGDLAYYPLILLGKNNHSPIRDSGAEDLTFRVMAEQHQLGYQVSRIKVNKGIARIDTRTGDMVDAEGQLMGKPKSEHLVSGMCYSAAVPPCNCDEGVLELAPRCRRLGTPKCMAAQVWVLVDGDPGELPELRRAANVYQCRNRHCRFRQEMGPTIYYYMNHGSTAHLQARGGSMIHYVATNERAELHDAETLEEYRALYESEPLNSLRESSNSGRASESWAHIGDSSYGGQCLSQKVRDNPYATMYFVGESQLAKIKDDMFQKKPKNPHTRRHEISFTTYQVLLWNCLGLNVKSIYSTDQLKSNPDIMAAESALEHLFLEQNYDENRHEWTPNKVMSRMQELLALHAPTVLASVKCRGGFDLHGTAEIIDYTVNLLDEVVVDQLQFCMAFADHPVMDNDIWQEKCFN